MAMLNPYNYQRPQKPINLKRPAPAAKPVGGKQQNGQGKADPYLEQRVMGAKPEELTLMLYEGAIKFLKQAQIFLGDKKLDKVNNSIQRAEDIIVELRATLNMDIALSENLDSLYEYMLSRLMDANLDKDHEILEEVIGLVTELKDTWKEAMAL